MKDYRHYHLFLPDEEKIAAFGKKLMDEYLYLSDEDRTIDDIRSIIWYYLSESRKNIVWEINNFDGLLVFANVIPGFKASLVFKMWNPKAWSAGFVRETREFLRENMEELHLVRLESLTADPRVMKMARLGGFEVEGIKQKSFQWKGHKYDEWVLGLIREEEDGLLHRETDRLHGLDEPCGEGRADGLG